MTDPMSEPEGPEDERFVYVVTAEGVEALREGAAAFDSEREAPPGGGRSSPGHGLDVEDLADAQGTLPLQAPMSPLSKPSEKIGPVSACS
jgi:hypothetical protein